jgi:asparagine synthase (glutamine-hydrolysing)
MCGIFAVVGLTGDPKRNRQRVYNLAKRIRHRGPGFLQHGRRD